jgi:Uma2 family endonuclease
MATPPTKLDELDISMPPTQWDLPYDDNETMETQRHKVQMELLIDSLEGWLEGREDGYVGGNMFVYYSLAQAKNQDLKGPDFFAVLGVPKGERLSWVCWEEGKTPDVVIELLSGSTAQMDKGTKKDIYQNQLHVPEYFWYDPFDPDDWAGFQLQAGSYQPIVPDEQGRLVSQVLQLTLVQWSGTYKGIETTWLRWADLEGRLLPTAAERAQQQAATERQRADAEQQRADAERQRAEKLAAQLRELGVNPDEI